eukprot:32102-Pleurochrysis_carterae.AAC.1
MKAVVHPFGGLGLRHHADVMMGARRVNGEAPLGVGCITIRDVTVASLYAPFEQPPRSSKRQDQAVSLRGRRGENSIHISKTTLRCRCFPQGIDREQ